MQPAPHLPHGKLLGRSGAAFACRHPVTSTGTFGGAALVLEAQKHSCSDAASTAAVPHSWCKYCSSSSLPHGSSRGAELQLRHCSLTQSDPVVLPIQGPWGAAAYHCPAAWRSTGPRRCAYPTNVTDAVCLGSGTWQQGPELVSREGRPGKGSSQGLTPSAAAAMRVPGLQSCQ